MKYFIITSVPTKDWWEKLIREDRFKGMEHLASAESIVHIFPVNGTKLEKPKKKDKDHEYEVMVTGKSIVDYILNPSCDKLVEKVEGIEYNKDWMIFNPLLGIKSFDTLEIAKERALHRVETFKEKVFKVK